MAKVKKKVDTSRRQAIPQYKPREIYLIIIKERADKLEMVWDELWNKYEAMTTEELRLIVHGSVGIE